MNPSEAYKSICQTGRKIRFLLVITIFIQIFFIGISKVSVPVPSFLVNQIVKSFASFTNDVQFTVEGTRLEGFSNLQFSAVNILLGNKPLARIQDFEFVMQPYSITEFFSSPFVAIRYERMDLLFDEKQNPVVKVRDFRLEKISSNHLSMGGTFLLKNHQLDLAGIFATNQKNDDQVNISTVFNTKFLEQSESFASNLANHLAVLPPVHVIGLITGSPNLLQLQLSQVDDLKENSINGVKARFDFEYDDQNKINMNFHANSLILESEFGKFSLLKPSCSGEIIINGDESSFQTISKLDIEKTTVHGSIIGKIPAFSALLKRDQKSSEVLVFSYNKFSKCSLAIRGSSPNLTGEGFIDVEPDQLDLNATLSVGTLKIISGDSLRLRLYENPNPMSSEIALFSIIANNFSALETPAGNFRFIGKVRPDYSILVSNAHGKFGRSEATGTFTQEWSPPNFRFLVKGACFPNDIGNWLGSWWSPIWKNFSFNEFTPLGDFSIAGVWGGEPGNSNTFGVIKAKNFSYRNFQANHATVKVTVDNNATSLRSNQISHTLGTLTGEIYIPLKHKDSPIQLGFDFSGDFPFNAARSIFGHEVENAVSDINASLIQCNGKGEILHKTLNPTDQNQTHFSINLSSEIPLTYKHIPIDSFEGSISRKNGLLEARFPSLSIAGGQGVLSFKELSQESEMLDLKFELKDARRSNFVEILDSMEFQNVYVENHKNIVVKEKMPSKIDEKLDGLIYLSLSAKGPASDPLQFEGSGKFGLSEVEIGNINFLGGIRSRLGSFNLPLPSDALSFNQLDAPFLLDHEILRFENINLSGPLSLLTANGTTNLSKQEVDLIADLKLAGNLKIPLLKQLVNLADPLAKMTSLKISGNWEQPEWKVHLTPPPLP